MVLRLIPDRLNIGFSKYRKITSSISLILIIFSVFSVAFKGINLGVDFTGGVLIEILSSNKNNLVIDLLNKNGLTVKASESGNSLIMNFKEIGNENTINTIKNLLEEKFCDSIIYRKVDYVGPQVSFIQILEGVLAISIAIFGIFMYIWLRFNWQYGLGGSVALIHDIILTLGFISIAGIEFNISSIAALLTVIGYSINDSIVIYDRIREYCNKEKETNEVINKSINTTLSRTIFTSGSTLLATIPLVLICKDTVRDFSLIISFGVLVGTYSSIFISIPILNINKSLRLKT